MKNWKSWFHWLIAFLLGGACSLFLQTRLHPAWQFRPCFGLEKKAECIAKHLSKEIGLSVAQRTQVEEIFRSHEQDLKTVHHDCHPRFMAVRNQISAEIDKILTEEQREKHKRFLERLEKSHLKHAGD